MQTPLSSTASGEQIRIRTTPAVLPCFSAEVNVHEMRPLPGEEQGPDSYLRDAKNPIAEGVGLAHDAGNLLGALGLYCELLAVPGVLREEHRHYARELQMISGRSRSMIDRLLSPGTTSRHALRAAPPEPDRVVVPEVIEQCRGLLNAIARRAVAVAYEAGAALPVAVPQESLERILVNLTKNAAEASTAVAGPSGGITLRVSCLRSDGVEPVSNPSSNPLQTDRIVLSVEDKGRGMSSAAVKVLLGKGTAAGAVDAAATAQGGSQGLGFRVVRELVGASGGRLRLFSRSGSGTTVEISWAVAPLPGWEQADGKRTRGEFAEGASLLIDPELLAQSVHARGNNGQGRTQC